MIEINNITLIRNGKKIVKNFSLNIKPSCITVIIGPNGCGKSTLLAAISGDIFPEPGEVKINGTTITSYSALELAKKRAVVMQTPIYTLGFRVKQIIQMAGAADQIIQELKLIGITDRLVTSLSGGESQKVALAQALAQQTPILILDEPLSSQDVESRVDIIEILKARASAGATVVVVAHSDEKNLNWADKIIEFPLLISENQIYI